MPGISAFTEGGGKNLLLLHGCEIEEVRPVSWMHGLRMFTDLSFYAVFAGVLFMDLPVILAVLLMEKKFWLEVSWGCLA